MSEKIHINLKQVRELLEIFNGEDADLVIIEGDGHSGHGHLEIKNDIQN